MIARNLAGDRYIRAHKLDYKGGERKIFYARCPENEHGTRRRRVDGRITWYRGVRTRLRSRWARGPAAREAPGPPRAWRSSANARWRMACSSARWRILPASRRRVNGSSMNRPITSLMKPGRISRPPASASIRPSSMVWAGNLAAVQAFTGTQAVARPAIRSTNTPNIEPRMISSRAGKKPDRPCHLDEYEQLQHREQQKEQQKRAHQMVPQRKNALPVSP